MWLHAHFQLPPLTFLLSPTSLITCACRTESCLHSHSTTKLFHVYILCSWFTSNWWSIVEPRSHNSISARHTLFGGNDLQLPTWRQIENPARCAPLVYSGCSLEMATKSGPSSPSSPLLASSSLETQFLRLFDPRGISLIRNHLVLQWSPHCRAIKSCHTSKSLNSCVIPH